MLSRILFFELNNVKNVWVFDGVPPVLKSETLKKRKEAKDAALQIINEAKSATEGEDREDILKYVKRSVFITNQMKKDAMTLVELLGMPCISVLYP